ncbi:hypothetical protein KCU78_g3276, partial [Aureobasidium melanogenum]
MLSNIINELSYPNPAITLGAGLSIVLLGLWGIVLSSPASLIFFTFVVYLWIWRLVAIGLRRASRYCRLCWIGSFGAALIFAITVAVLKSQEPEYSPLYMSERLVQSISGATTLATVYVQLQRHVRKMAGDQKISKRWLYAGGLCATTTVIASVRFCLNLTQRPRGWPYTTPSLENIDIVDWIISIPQVASMIIFWISALYMRVRSNTRRDDMKVLAEKVIDVELEDNQPDRPDPRRECKILSELSHPNIASFIDVDYRKNELRLYMEFYKHQSLDHLKTRCKAKNKELAEPYVWSILYQLSSALVYCHYGIFATATDGEQLPPPVRTQTVLHRDIKPANVFLASDSETALDAIKLGDFGIGVVIEDKTPHTYVGTPVYLPPEIRKVTNKKSMRRWTDKCDIFSLGCTMFEICNLKARFDTHAVLPEDIKTSLKDTYGEKLQKCLRQCIQHDPASRPDARALFRTAREYVASPGIFDDALREYRLVEAASRGDMPMIEEQIKLGADIHASLSTDGETALHKAIRHGDPNTVSFILGHKADPSRVNKEGHTALHTAAAYALKSDERRVIVDLLWGKGLEIRCDNHRRTPLHCAAAQNNYDVIQAMYESGADLEIMTTDTYHSRAIHIAAENDHVEAMKTLVRCGADIQSTRTGGANALHIAAKNGHVAAMLYCLSLKIPVNSKFGKGKMTALHLAAESGHEAAVLALIQKQAKRNEKTADGQTPLHLAASRGHASVVFALLTGESKPTSLQDDSVIYNAAILSSVDKQQLNMSDVNSESALHLAVKSGQAVTVTTLLNLGSKYDAMNADGDTPLHLACLNGDQNIVHKLLEKGAPVNARGPKQNTPLHYAASRGHETVVEVLLTNDFSKASLQERTSSGDTALHIAAEFDRDALVSKLFQHNVSGESVNRNGETALHRAAAKGNFETIRTLLSHGVENKTRNHTGQTASEVAKQHGHYRCVRKLRENE